MGDASPSSTEGKELSNPRAVSADERRLLLDTARSAARAFLIGQPSPKLETKIVARFGGAFVTFFRGTRLRGCVGSFAETTDILATVTSVTRSSLVDPRFASCPVQADELDELTIELSLLTTPVRTDDPASLVLGVDGVTVRCGRRSGCFLPKVAADRGWSAEELLSNCCTMKAGLPADAWKDPASEICLFRADVFDDASR